MPSPPIRRSASASRVRSTADARPTRAELDSVHLLVEDFRSRLEPLAARLAQMAKSIDAQQKRLDALTAGLEQTRVALEVTRDVMTAHAQAATRGPLAWTMERLRALRARPMRAAPLPALCDAPPPAPVAPKLNWVLAGGRAGPQARAVMVALFGLSAAEIDTVVAKLTAAAEPAPAELVRVFLTDGSAFDAFRARGLPFEYLPPTPRDPARRGQRDWGVYQLRRFALLCEKWQPVEVVGFGPVATARLAEWQASPHLPATVKQLLAVADNGPPTSLA